MSNILNGNNEIIKLRLNNNEYYDFRISTEVFNYTLLSTSTNDKCLLGSFNPNEKLGFDYIKLPFNNNDNINEIINNGITLKNVGFTFVDNGKIKFDKFYTLPDEFKDIFFKSSYTLNKDDKSFKLEKVDGNNQIFDYSANIEQDENGIKSLKLNGGFYQGVWKINEDYQALPLSETSNYTFIFKLKKSNYENNNYTLNKKHPNNKGIFFYIGTRSENKWVNLIKNELLENQSFNPNGIFGKGYIDFNGLKCECNQKDNSYFKENFDFKKKNTILINPNDSFKLKPNNDGLLGDNYFKGEFNNYKKTPISKGFIASEKIKISDIKSDNNRTIFYKDPIRIKTNNKFLWFDRTDNGYTTCTWDKVKNNDFFIEYEKPFDVENYFLLFHRGENGLNPCNIKDYINKKKVNYDIIKDLTENAFALRIKDDGSIGYRYLISDCDKKYKIEEEYSKSNIVNDDEWVDIKAQIEMVDYYDKCKKPMMRVKLYHNNKLILVSKKLPYFNFRKLDIPYELQETIPFNLSLGGGTQGLSDTININYREKPHISLPIEENFSGSFIGNIKELKIHKCLI